GLAVAHLNLGIALRTRKRFEEALAAFQRATELRPDYSEALDALAHAHMALYDWDGAVQVLNRIIARWPGKAEMFNNLGSVYQAMGRNREAIAAYEQALRINPRLAVALNSLGSAYLGQGDFAAAGRCLRQCLEVAPADLRARSNRLMLLNYMPELEAEKVLEEHLEWGRVATRMIATLPPLAPADPQRRLRIGYLSPDFREHSVASFIEPLLANHDHDRFEVCCYSCLPRPDATTLRLKGYADRWRDIDRLSDADTARLVRDDGIDILVDLVGHTSNHRLGVFAARPAPVQLTYLGYPNTTGLATIDYRITDAIADPPGEEAWHSEELLRLDGGFLCYQPDPNSPDASPLPALATGQVTFGSFNNFSKLNPAVLELWAQVLQRVPGSRLLLKCPALTDAALREHTAAALQALGIGAERLELLGHTPTRAEHLALYARLDIALDTFPYNGTTTTCEALWMGVPVVTLAGRRHAGRVGASLLEAAGLGGPGGRLAGGRPGGSGCRQAINRRNPLQGLASADGCPFRLLLFVFPMIKAPDPGAAGGPGCVGMPYKPVGPGPGGRCPWCLSCCFEERKNIWHSVCFSSGIHGTKKT
ncbi:MAG: tetratricopeptide repeat protein, partial [Xanthomonadaceae bacterium]|nr:tetratricopeptide repeat protein [Xanthomonadaceae bacterium]